MFRTDKEFNKVYINKGYTDLRLGIDGLARLIGENYNLNPYDKGTLFLFCGRRKDRIKGLLWQGDGFLLLYKRLEDGKFQWPREKDELDQMTLDQYFNLMNGLTVYSTIKSVSPTQVG